MFKEKQIVTDIVNHEMYAAMFEFARKMGVPVYEGSGTKEKYKGYPNITFYNNELCGNCTEQSRLASNGYEQITLEAFFRICAEYDKSKLKLNAEYTAEIDREKQVVRVGCQTIEFDAVRKLARLLDKQ